jgi:hypothetical protein
VAEQKKIVEEHRDQLMHKRRQRLLANAQTESQSSSRRQVEESALESKRAAPVVSERIPFKIRMDYTHLAADSGYTCYQVGQVVQLSATESYTCQSVDLVDLDLRNLIQTTVMPAVQAVFESLLLVDDKRPVKLDEDAWDARNGNCVDGIPIAESFVSSGMTGEDLLVFVSARPCDSVGRLHRTERGVRFPLDSGLMESCFLLLLFFFFHSHRCLSLALQLRAVGHGQELEQPGDHAVQSTVRGAGELLSAALLGLCRRHGV